MMTRRSRAWEIGGSRRIPLRVAGIYALIGGVWILLSDRILLFLVDDPAEVARLQTLKGWFYVALTAVVLYLLVRGMLRRVIRSEQALARSSEKYRMLVERQADLVVEVDADNRLAFVSPSYCRLFGRTEQDLLGRSFLPLIHEDDREAVARAMESVKHPPHASQVEERMMTADGWRWYAWANQAVLDAEGRITGIIGVGRDVTERKRMEEERIRVGALESVSVLAGGIAHDFNNLLTVIFGNLSLARFELPAGSDLQARLADAEQAAMRAKDLTFQLLTFAKGGAPVLKPHSIADLVRDTARFVTRGSAIRCDFTLPPDLPPVHVDPGQVSQVIQNLVLNAVQAMSPGGTVHVAAEAVEVGRSEGLLLEPGRYVRLAIRDEGPGIPPEILPRIFDPFFTTKQKGSGLGLATAHAIVAKHQGHISVESEPGRGTTFLVYLPVADDLPADAAADDEGPHPSRRAGRILVMDDDDAVRTVLLRMLEQLGYEAVGVPDGAAAIERYGREREAGRPFAAVIMDLTVPGGMGGREALQGLRALDPGVVALVASGYSNDPILANLAASGFQGRVPKPFLIEELRKALDDAFAAAPL